MFFPIPSKSLFSWPPSPLIMKIHFLTNPPSVHDIINEQALSPDTYLCVEIPVVDLKKLQWLVFTLQDLRWGEKTDLSFHCKLICLTPNGHLSLPMNANIETNIYLGSQLLGYQDILVQFLFASVEHTLVNGFKNLFRRILCELLDFKLILIVFCYILKHYKIPSINIKKTLQITKLCKKKGL